MKNLPTVFQRNVLWTAITALSIAFIGWLAIKLISLATEVMAFLQPILVPFAVAGVLAYLLEPGVEWLERRGLNRQRSVLLTFGVFTLAIVGLGWWIVVKLDDPTRHLADRVPVYYAKAQKAVVDFSAKLEKDYDIKLLPHTASAAPLVIPGAEVLAPVVKEGGDAPDADLQSLLSGDWVKTTLPKVPSIVWNFLRTSVGGFLGVFGFLLSFIIVPLYLYYFLIESAKIQEKWSDYLPLRASAFKDELVSCLNEINSYLVAFFRGQLFVSVINGIATGIGLMIVGLDFGLLIGLALCVAGIIPYLGIILCWIPAVIIASVQGGSSWISADPWWVMPLVVTGVFALVQQIDALFITPRIVGEAVGLHPMTVIASVLVWGLLLGGLLGAILAVPLTASVKVLFQRYVWHARIAPQTIGGSRRGEAAA
ncbi:MAG: AI-2E family transporter [Prosthecobacter sp.]|uniref:AI-2E family transporter n=1 Tax=Prosthecobacter sp. TaxID=1965333 RepID=UPI0025FADD55|nr:AI-2E family transporter [Prosthecobacter sp.]MCF7784798.1 AI-2E family transporter [Prosthecobacter sp.]